MRRGEFEALEQLIKMLRPDERVVLVDYLDGQCRELTQIALKAPGTARRLIERRIKYLRFARNFARDGAPPPGPLPYGGGRR